MRGVTSSGSGSTRAAARRAVSIVSTGQHALWRVIEVKLHSVRCLYVVARARGEGGGLSG